jgi:hypothetical protein
MWNPFYLFPPIVFSFRAHAFFYLGTIRCFSWNDTTISHKRFDDIAVWIHLRMFFNSIISPFSCLNVGILFEPVLGGVDGNLYFSVPSMNRVNQTEPATFYHVRFSLGILFFSILIIFNINKNIYTKKWNGLKHAFCKK